MLASPYGLSGQVAQVFEVLHAAFPRWDQQGVRLYMDAKCTLSEQSDKTSPCLAIDAS